MDESELQVMVTSPSDPTVVVMGQGYVGLPVAQAAVASDMRVYGFEVDEFRVEAINSGRSHVDDISDEQLDVMLDRGYRASNDPEVISEADIIVVCVPTPLDEHGGPDLSAVELAVAMTGANLKLGTTVILESTTYPGTTEDVVLPILEAKSGMRCGEDFYLSFSPERIDPGSKNWNLRNTPKLVGGITSEATQRAVTFYERFVETVVPLSGAKEAETAKLLENTYRHVNIALVNEMAQFCHELDINIWEVIRGAATKPFGFKKFTPGPGVGGHCIPIDPNYLAFQVKKRLGYQFRFVELAQEINNSMPSYVVGRVGDLLNDVGKPLNGSKVLLLGVTYKPDIADQRESPAIPIATLFREKQVDLSFHDPLIDEWHLPSGSLYRARGLDSAIENADVVILLQGHNSYDINAISRKSHMFFDARGDDGAQMSSVTHL